MAGGSGLNFIGLITTQAATFAISLALARWLGARGLGVYAQAFAVLSLLQMVGMGGLHTGTMRFVALNRATGNDGAVVGSVLLGLTAATAMAAVLGLGVYLGSGWLAGSMFNEPRLAQSLRAVAIALPAATFTGVALGATQGFKTMRASASIGLIFEPIFRVVLTLVVLATGAGVIGAMSALVVSNYVAAALAARALRSLLARRPPSPVYEPRRLFTFSSVSWLGSLANSGLIWADTIILGIFRPSSEVGVYTVATRLVVLASLVQTAINSALGPRIADLYARRDHDALSRAYRAAASWTVRLALPAFAVLTIFPEELLSFFGRGFVVAGSVTVLLALGKLVDAATGPCALMLNMSGRPLVNTLDNLSVLAVNVALNLALVPRFGLIGAAASWTISLVLVNVARVLQVGAAMQMWPFGTAMLKGALGAIAGGAAAHLVSESVGGVAGLLAGVAALGGVYLMAVAIIGLSSEDRLVLTALRGRLPSPR